MYFHIWYWHFVAVRKRGPRQISEGSNNSDAAGPIKKASKLPVNKIGAAEESSTEPLATLQVNPSSHMNGPTSQAKRSTRSSGISGE